MHKALISIFLVSLAIPFSFGEAPAQLEREKIGNAELVTVLPRDAIPAITRPEFVSTGVADRWMLDDEPILGLVDPVSGEARAYSLWHLDHHEIVNDTFAGDPVAVTW